LKVQHWLASCDGTVSRVGVTVQPVSSPQSTFLLVSSDESGTMLGPDDFYTAALTAADRVELQYSMNCSPSTRVSIQVVEVEGASVTRGVTGGMTGAELIVSNLPAVDLASTALLFTYRASGPDTGLCDRAVRGELTSPTSLRFSRGEGAAGCDGVIIDAISWERIDFGPRARAQHVPVTMNAGTTVVSLPLTEVDLTRTLAFASGQAQSGQAGGEGSYQGDDILGEVVGRHALTSPTTLEVTRGSSNGSARWSSIVLEIEP
jgi:hypothetical protein